MLKRLCDFVNINEPSAKKYSEILSYKWKTNIEHVKSIFATKKYLFLGILNHYFNWSGSGTTLIGFGNKFIKNFKAIVRPIEKQK